MTLDRKALKAKAEAACADETVQNKGRAYGREVAKFHDEFGPEQAIALLDALDAAEHQALDYAGVIRQQVEIRAGVEKERDAAVARAERAEAEAAQLRAGLSTAFKRWSTFEVSDRELARHEEVRRLLEGVSPRHPPGKVPLSVKDPTAQDLLWEYAQRRRKVDVEFADDLEFALRSAGYKPIEELIAASSLGDPSEPDDDELAIAIAAMQDADSELVVSQRALRSSHAALEEARALYADCREECTALHHLVNEGWEAHKDLPLALRNLRHLYEQMVGGLVHDTASAARGLLGPAIEKLERIDTALAAESKETDDGR